MNVLGMVLGALGGAALGVSAMVLFVFACSLVGGASDTGATLAGLGTLGSAVVGGVAGAVIAGRRRGPPPSGSPPPVA